MSPFTLSLRLNHVLGKPVKGLPKPLEKYLSRLMAANTTSNRFLLNLNSLNSVATSASGNNAVLSNAVTNLQTVINPSNYTVSVNSLTSYTGSNIAVGANLNLSNAGVYFNSNIGLLSNSLNGVPYLAFLTNGQERARLNVGNLGIGTKTPLAPLDVGGDELVRGNLYVSSMGLVVTSSIGNVFADGSMFAAGFYQPSDPSLKTNVSPYISQGLPTPVRFTWKATGLEDIGVLADEVKRLEPSCVSMRGAAQTVDYSKLVVMCLAEIHSLRSTVASLVELSSK